MADKKTQKDIKSVQLLPKFYQTDANKKFLHATIEQLIQPGTVTKINGFVGRKNAKATTASDIFISEPTLDRQNYQLEPGLVIKDDLDNTTFFKDYADYINQINIFSGNIDNHSRLNEQEFYSWDPHINWDKFVNFQNYYWLPYGPDVVNVFGQQQEITSTYEVIVESQQGSNAYIFSPKGSVGLIRNPTIKLYKGQTYYFDINSPGNVFSIKTSRTSGVIGRYETDGLSNNSIETGTIKFTVPYNAPNFLYYVSENDIDLGGVFEIQSILENTAINVEEEILGKKTYTLSDGNSLSNGMKIRFVGKVTPTQYETGLYYVEGVGDSIKLINETVLELISQYTTDQTILFDNTPFDSLPFSDATSFAGTPDYIVINRGSDDHNPWSRYNRWFHKDVIEKSAEINNKIASIDQNFRAVRPIIEFEPNLRLFNFGTTAIKNIDLVDDFTSDVFSSIEGQLGYNVDGIDLAQDQRILFTADNDIFVKNKIFKVQFLTLNGIRRIHLELDTDPVNDNVALVKLGNINQGLMYWYSSDNGWKLAQQKYALNQQPLFDVVDENKNSYGDNSYYDGSTFTGTKLFSYQVGTGITDSNLGFPLTYKNINNIGDIVFNFNLSTDTFQYKDVANVINLGINKGFLTKTENNEASYLNGWQTCKTTTVQAGVRIYKDANLFNNFPIDIFDNKNNLSDLVVRVYINGIRLDRVNSDHTVNWTITDSTVYKVLTLTQDISNTDVLSIRTFAKQPINSNGYYEIPINLQNNPLNQDLKDLTLGEVIDHVNSIVENTPNFIGRNPGPNNLRDLGNVTKYGTKFVQHSGPLGLSLYHITSETNNVIKAIEIAKNEYNKFKKNFITVAETLGVDADPIKLVDIILQKINKDKSVNFPYYFSDMVPYGASNVHQHSVLDSRIKFYPLTQTFGLTTLSNRAVNVYHTTNTTTTQLLYGIDYTFNEEGFVVISSEINVDDVITIYEYDDTHGSFVPATPTKLGLWPKYTPKKFVNSALLTPREMIQGHDGSLVLAYGDYRDDLILELEKRIYNNIKVEYDSTVFDIYDVIPGYYRDNDYSLTEFNSVLAPNFFKWTTLIDKDFTKSIGYERTEPLTFNYRNHTAPDGREVPGYWRGIYRWILDTDKPNICPWEILGFSEQPAWWEDRYGPAPYTRDNLILWQDINDGIVREPGQPPVKREKFARPGLIDHIPVDEFGNLASPIESGLASGVITQLTEGDFIFGDVSPIEGSWRTSSYYPFSVITASLLLKPAKTFGVLLDRSRIVRNLAGQFVYKDTGLRVTPASVKLPSIYSSTSIVYTSGIINYIVDYILSDNLKSYTSYRFDLDNLKCNLSYRVSGFTSKDKFKFILDSKTPLSSSTVFVPQEDYDIVLNGSSPIKKITYSGVIITKLESGFEIKGYSKTQPYFKYYPWRRPGPTINIGGISETFSVWTPGQVYNIGSIVKYNNNYYRSLLSHTALTEFNPSFYTRLSSLPIIGGREANFRKEWDRTEDLILPYGTTLREIQDVVDFLLGYGEWLKDQGFVFDEFNANLNLVSNWELSAKEFLFWTTQNWSTGEDKWQEWTPTNGVEYSTIVRYNGEYYRAIRTIEPSSTFDIEDYIKLDGLSTVGSSVISLSPSAMKLIFSTPLSVVDDIRSEFNGYEIFAVDGVPIRPNFLNSYREDNTVTYIPEGNNGIYCATFYLKQYEQVVIFNNTTMFNDTIYNPASGYRQERLRVAGYKTSYWDGSFNAPGFVFDQAKIQEWQSWKDYNLGDIVKYKEFYYSAKQFLVGTESFVMTDWIKLDSKPSTRLLPNWTYKASQFEDFYSLDSDNFDSDQQSVAQHLIGYQKRQYLDNIIKDDVSEYKFYQGMIAEKGTHNVLNKLFDVLSAADKESLDFYEEWAVRIGNYGASCAFENIEIVLDESKFKINPQGFELVNIINEEKLDFIIRQTPNDVYVKPIGYNSNPWPINNNFVPYLRSAGYVRASDVSLIIHSIEDIVTKDPTDFNYGDYIWCGFENRSWNVYRYSDSNLTVTDCTYSENILTITVDGLVTLDVGDYIGIPQYNLKGFYKVETISLDTFTVNATLPNWDGSFNDFSSILIFKLTSQRVGSINEVDEISVIGNGELLWTDNGGNNKWATWEYQKVFNESNIPNIAPREIEVDESPVIVNFGKTVLLNHIGNIAVIANTLGELITYDKASPADDWKNRDSISPPFISKSVGTSNPTPPSVNGDVISISSDNTWMITGVPLASAVCTRFVEDWEELNSYSTYDIVRYDGVYYEARSTLQLQLSNNVTAPKGAFIYQADTEAYGYLEEEAVASNVIILSKFSPTAFNTTGNLTIEGDDTPGTFNTAVKPTVVTIDDTIPTNVNPSANSGYWKRLYYLSVDSSLGNNSSLTNQGAIAVYKKDKNNIFTLIDVITSPVPVNNEKFGWSIATGKNLIAVSAIGNTTDTGIVYLLNYEDRVQTSAYYNPIGSSGQIIKLSRTLDIEEGMKVKGIGFKSGQYVAKVVDGTTIILNAAPDSEPNGNLEFTISKWGYSSSIVSPGSINEQFGYTIVISKDESVIAISAPGTSTVGKVYIYTEIDGLYVLTQTIVGDAVKFGESITISNDGSYLAISSLLFDGLLASQGKVTVYTRVNGLYVTDTTNVNGPQNLVPISEKIPDVSETLLFGTKISFMNDFKTLVVYSRNADTYILKPFTDGTTFDSELTRFVELNADSGRVDIYDRYDSNWVFSETLDSNIQTSDNYGCSMSVGKNKILVGAKTALDNEVTSGKVFEYSKLDLAYTWKKIHEEGNIIDIRKIKRAYLYDRSINKIVTYLDVIDPIQGKIAGPADQEIKFKTFYDPATYSVGTSSAVNVDNGMAWNKSHVGQLWWDLRTTKFVESQSTDIVYANNTWNTLFSTATVDIYEWVETSLLPSEWDSIADTEEGLSDGISGLSLYGDNAYSIVEKYDNISKTLVETYYFWVKNKKTIPSNAGRNLSAQDVSDLIENPRGEGYRYIGLTGTNTFSIANVENILRDKNIILSIEYWTIDQTSQNIHSQWSMINTSANSRIPPTIEKKWFDSLCGKDEFDRLVPDMNLPLKLRYGIENRPRQGMFINRFEALKQLFEKVNRVLINYQIAEQKNLTKLETFDEEPSTISGLYDLVLDTDLELRFSGAGIFVKPVLEPVIVNGRFKGINIVEKGKGYNYAPYIEVVGSGEGAILKTIIGSSGQVTGVEVIQPGHGYDSNTVLILRNYCVLVHKDTQANGGWSIYSYDKLTSVWSRIRSQAYDTRKYWEYADWYETGYNQFISYDYAVDTFVGLFDIEADIGDLVKIRTNNSGRWMILEKYNNSDSVDWTQSYKVVGLQNGTIQFSSSIYNYIGSIYGYDGTLYDTEVFDVVASSEVRYILEALRDDILVDNLRSEYINLFFITIRYALTEQLHVDWIFKTSFVKAQHSVGELKQKVTYNNDNLSDFEAYVAEVKPYRTQIREYVSSYSKLDEANSSITDFDLPPVYQNRQNTVIDTSVVNGEIFCDNNAITLYPWKFWLDNVGFSILELKIVDGGSGYVSEPIVRFQSNSGSGAEARAFISNGKVNRILLKSPGSKYLAAPTVIIDGGVSSEGTPARVVAIIGNSVVRSNLIKMKFDRITSTYFITQMTETETFTGTGTRVQFPLTWAPDIRIGKSTVLINSIEELRDNYRLEIIKSTAKGYTTYSGSIVFDTAPANGSIISVTYLKDWSILNAADRIQYYYNPTTGELGKDLGQLMTGVDYGGAIVQGLNFEVGSGWDSLPYYSEKWDSFDTNEFDDYIVTVDAGTDTFELPYIPTVGTEINLYYSKTVTASYTSDGNETIYLFDTSVVYPPKVTVTRSVTTNTFNDAGQFTISLISSVGIEVGDIVTLDVVVPNVIGFGTKVAQVNGSIITLDQILFDDITAGTSLVFTRQLITPTDCVINKNGTVILKQPIVAGNNINIISELRPVRIDDPNYGSSEQINSYAVMETWIADGQTSIISFDPDNFVLVPEFNTGVQTGDKFILRKSTSDGSIAPQESDYDTALKGGDLAYNTATGLLAEDIIVDGDGFVTPYTSNAPEEVVPGQVVDSVAIKVYDRPLNGSANIKIDTYVSDGVTDTFEITQRLNSQTAIIVKFAEGSATPDLITRSIVQTINVDYTVDYRNSTIHLNSAPDAGIVISIFSFGFNGSNLLDLDSLVGDGITRQFITTARWVDNFVYLIYVDGQSVIEPNIEIFRTEASSANPDLIGIRFAQAPNEGAIVNYVFVNGPTQTFSITKSERFQAIGALTYNLQNKSGIKLPIESNMIVRVDQNILQGPVNSYFTIKNNRKNYLIDKTKFVPFSVSSDEIVVIADQTVLTPNADYLVDLAGIKVTINKTTYDQYAGKELIVSIIKDADYFYNPGIVPSITFLTAYNNNETIEVITSFNHDILDTQRTAVNVTTTNTITPNTVEYFDYLKVKAGTIILDREVIDDQYVWITKNGSLLTPSVDFKLNLDRSSITLAREPNENDKFVIITYSTNVLTSGIAYMQFKDMLNRTHYKRLSQNKQSYLVDDLRYYDLTIKVDNASNFDLPNPTLNKPGVIEIRGERIEYFTVTNEEFIEEGETRFIYVLGQLRRGTLGTGTPNIHRKGALVQDIGPSETIPYTDVNTVEQVVSDGTNIIQLSFVPSKADSIWNFDSTFTSLIPSNYGQSNDIEVFVGGYEIGDEWKEDTEYVVGKIVSIGSYTYRCIQDHTSSSTFKTDKNYWAFFAGNIRLKKHPYKLFNINEHPESTEGDVQFDADFAVDGTSKELRLTNELTFGTQVTVIKKSGKVWDSTVNILDDNSKVANFLKATPGIWYSGIDKYESTSETAFTFDSATGTFDGTSTTFDQG